MGDARRSRMVPLSPGYEGGPNVLQLRHDHQEQHQAPLKGDDVQVVASMARRLSSLERELREKCSLVHKLQQENDALKAKVKASDESHHHHHNPSHKHHHLSSNHDSMHPSTQAAAPAQSSACASACEPSLQPSSGSDMVHQLQSETDHLRSETSRLRKQLRQAWGQVASMKQFLEDYGMVWVGEPVGPPGGEGELGSHSLVEVGAGPALRPGTSDAIATSAGARHSSHSVASTSAAEAPPSRRHTGGTSSSAAKAAGLPFSMQRLMAALDELNDMAGDGVGQLVGDGVAGKPALLQAPEAVRLVLYEDGLQVHRLPPMQYGEASAKAVLQDIMDGFFPYCLKADFPDGVPIRLVDRTTERLSTQVGIPGAKNIRTFLDLDDLAPRQRPARQPYTVIRNGQVIEVGGDGRQFPVAGPGSQPASRAAVAGQVALVSTPVDTLLTTSQRNHGGPSLPPPSRDGLQATASSSHSLSSSAGLHLPPIHGSRSNPDISVLQVKSEDGRCTFILKLEYDDTIASLRKYVDAHRAEMAAGQGQPAPSGSYEIRSAFPARAFNDPKETLRAAGLVPNATLFLRATR